MTGFQHRPVDVWEMRHGNTDVGVDGQTTLGPPGSLLPWLAIVSLGWCDELSLGGMVLSCQTSQSIEALEYRGLFQEVLWARPYLKLPHQR